MRACFRRPIMWVLAVVLLFTVAFALPVTASAADTVIGKVLTTLSATPVALMDPSQTAVATSTPGCYIISSTWYDANGKAASGAFNAETYRLEIRVGASEGYVIDAAAACYLNNSAVTATVDANGKAVTLVREYTAAVWAPTVYKNPGAETVNEGGWASFVVSGSYVLDYQWMLLNPSENEVVPVAGLSTRFPGVSAAGDGTAKLMLYNIPYELNGWKVLCNLVGVGAQNNVKTSSAILTVIPNPGRVLASPTPTLAIAESSPDPVETVPDDLQEAPEATPEPTPHVHQFTGSWQYDAEKHWRICPEDGERGDEGPHDFTWTLVSEPTYTERGEESGVCSVCGAEAVRYTSELSRKDLPGPSVLLLSCFGIGAADVILVPVAAITAASKKRHRKGNR